MTKNGALQEPFSTRKPNTMGEAEAERLPAMFITPVTVPLYSPPTSMGTAQAGPITISKKKNEPVRQVRAVHSLAVVAAGMRQMAEASMAGAAIARRASFTRPVFLYSRSVKVPPTMSPTMPARNGSEANMPTACSERWRYSSRYVGNQVM